ncbi:hypothetical protein [Hafnia paralvei]|uniref:hypothetical protein n=1 Tax=Hafnia paralvei TaxID=546367 RepID=UPI0018F0E9EC|nr:hypothetical protein [Hafnia paralvei]MBW2958946.1 hypothetical protein [Hafnia paralvei]
MNSGCFDEFIWATDEKKKSSGKKAKRAKLENQDGSSMFVAEFVTIKYEEEQMSNQSPHLKVPLTFKSALWLSLGVITIVIASAWTAFTYLDSKIESSRINTEAKIDALGADTRAHFESSRLEAKTDNSAINAQLQTISNSMAELNGRLSKDSK